MLHDLPFADYQAYKRDHLDASTVPALSAAYQEDAERTARLRVFVAGERLARLLTRT